MNQIQGLQNLQAAQAAAQQQNVIVQPTQNLTSVSSPINGNTSSLVQTVPTSAGIQVCVLILRNLLLFFCFI